MIAAQSQGQMQNSRYNPQGAYQAQEQEKKPQPLAQASGASAVQPNAQPQTFATLQRQGFARPAPPNPQQGTVANGAMGRPAPQQQPVNAQAPAGFDQEAINRDPQGYARYQQEAAAAGWQNGQRVGPPQEFTQPGGATNGQGMNEQGIPWEELRGGRGTAPPQGGGALPNGFNGQAPNFNPLDYMVGQMMQPSTQTNFAGQAQNTQFQGYTPTSGPQLEGAQTSYGNGYGNIGVQGGGGGVASNYQGSQLDPFGVGSFANQGGPVADATQQKMLDILNKPSGWDSELVQNMYGQMGGQIDDQFAQQDTAINEEMAKRGLYDSSIAAGRLKDSNIGKRDAKTNLADSLLQQMGMNYGSDQARAAGLGAGYQGQQFGENAQTFGLNQGAEQQAFGQQLSAEQAAQGAFGLNQQGQIANSNAGIASMNANLQAQQANQQNAYQYANLNSQNALANNNQRLDLARFQSGENQFGTNTANQNAQQRFQNSLTGGQQDFNNRVTNTNLQRDMLGNIVNYGQQQFNNDITQQGLNRQLSNDEWDRLISTLGLR